MIPLLAERYCYNSDRAPTRKCEERQEKMREKERERERQNMSYKVIYR